MSFHKRTLRSVPLDHKTVLLRTDYNVPLREDGSIGDDFRIRASIPTIEYLLSLGCKVVIISHLGRPNGRDKRFSLESVGQDLARKLGRDVRFVDETIGHKAMMAAKTAPSGSIVMFENLRFYKEEEENDGAFASELAKASGAEYFVQDGFGVVHRAHASTDAITHYLPSVAGLLLEKEYSNIIDTLEAPKRPLLAVLGGAKVSDKIGVIEKFVDIADTIFIGGAMANTFLAYKGNLLGKSKVETGQDNTIERIYEKACRKVGKEDIDNFLILPVDLAVSPVLCPEPETDRKVVPINDVSEDELALDIGNETIERLIKETDQVATVIWNGTLGYAECSQFAQGSARLAQTLAKRSDIISIIGGGDTADFVLHWDKRGGDSFTHISTGGGASLELIAGKKLPGIESLLDA